MHWSTLATVLSTAALAAARDLPANYAQTVSCQKKTLCNGDLCSDACVSGTVPVDAWVNSALAFQRELQTDMSLLYYEQPGSHNSAISRSYGIGIEDDGLTEILTPLYGAENGRVRIANQFHSLTDQLRMGVRHLEIDVHTSLFYGFRVAHWRTCPPDFYLLVQGAIGIQHLDVDWDCSNLGMDKNRYTFEDMLNEINDWLTLPENANEFVVLYLDNKSVYDISIPAVVKLFKKVFGSRLFKQSEIDTLYGGEFPTLGQVVASGKQVLLQNSRESWSNNDLANEYFFTPVLWDIEFYSDEFVGFPACTTQDETFYKTKQVRALDSSLQLGPLFYWGNLDSDYTNDVMASMTSCSVTTQAIDQIIPEDMVNFVWSWDYNVDFTATNKCGFMGGQSPNMWKVTGNCSEATKYAACKSDSNELDWVLSDSQVTFDAAATACPASYTFATPKTGMQNSVLKAAVIAAGKAAWVNYST